MIMIAHASGMHSSGLTTLLNAHLADNAIQVALNSVYMPQHWSGQDLQAKVVPHQS